MRKTLKTFTVMSAVLLLFVSVTPTASAATISIAPASQTAAIGTDVLINVWVDGLVDGAAPSLGVYDLDVTFDQAALAFADVSWGTGLDLFGLGNLHFATPGVGVVNLFELSFDAAADLDDLQAASFVLATLRFTALAAGAAPLGIVVNAFGDADGQAIDAVAEGASVRIVEGDTEPAVVAEPGTLVLVGSALLWSVRVFRRNGKAR